MSQQRARKPPGSREAAAANRSSFAKASGDPAVPPTRPKNNERSRSKNKIPKSIRYDLENALVGLCDVWFEDIKPHLIRNNIKLHVDGMGALGLAGCNNGVLPTAAPGCSHLDPGAAPIHRPQSTVNFASCCSTRQTASKAPCPRQTAEYPTSPPLPCSSPLTHNSISQNKKRKQRSCKLKPNKSQTLVPVSSHTSSQHRVSRACRASYFLPSPSRTQIRIRIPDASLDQNPLQYSKTQKNKIHQEVDNNVNSNTKSTNTRQKNRNINICHEEVQTDQTPKIPNLHFPQKNMKVEQSTKNVYSPIPIYSPMYKYPNYNRKDKTYRISSVPFGSIPNAKVRFKHVPKQRHNIDYAKYGLRKICSMPNSQILATRCSACCIQKSDFKMRSKQSSEVKSQRKDHKEYPNKISLDCKGPTIKNIDYRTQNATGPETPPKESLDSNRISISEINNERFISDENGLEIKPKATKVLKKESAQTNVEVKPPRRRDAPKYHRYPDPRMPGRIVDSETPLPKSRAQSKHKQNLEEPKLFDSSLVDLIAKQEDTRLKLLYMNQTTDTTTTLNLAIGSRNKRRAKVRNVKKKPPWK